MKDQSRVFLASLAGAAIGALVGYLYFTAGGRRLRAELEPRLDDAQQEIRRLRSTVTKAQAVATEGWQSLTDLLGERERERPRSGHLTGQTRQSSPF